MLATLNVGRVDDPPKGWAAMMELLAVAEAPPPPQLGWFSRVFMGPVGRARLRSESYFGRLGLATAKHAEQRYNPTSRVDYMVGPTIVRGKRHGREVEVRIDADRYRTKVAAAAVPEFHVRSDDGRLRASERSPALVHETVGALSQDSRWEGVEVKGGGDGITVFRHFGRLGSSQQGYLDDLWLAEALAERLA